MAQEYVIQNQGAVILESDGGFIVEEGLLNISGWDIQKT